MTSPDEEIQRIVAKSRALTAEGLDEQDEALLRKAVSRFPNDSELCLRTAVVLIGSAPEESEELVRRAIRLAPEDPVKLFRAALAMFSLGAFDEVHEFLVRAMAVAPDDFQYDVDVLHLAGRLAAQTGQDELAEEALSTAFEEAPQWIGHGEELAEFLARRGRPVDALRVVSEALRHRPDEDDLRELRREILAQLR